MAKWRLNVYSNLVLWIGFFVLLYFQLFWIAAAVFAVRYFLIGLVPIAHIFTSLRKPKISNFFQRISCRPTLLPYFKNYYYWDKSTNMVFEQIEDEEKGPLYYAEKVSVPLLYTYNAQSVFCGYLASLYGDLGHMEQAREYLQKAIDIPHRSALDPLLDMLCDATAEEE